MHGVNGEDSIKRRALERQLLGRAGLKIDVALSDGSRIACLGLRDHVRRQIEPRDKCRHRRG